MGENEDHYVVRIPKPKRLFSLLLKYRYQLLRMFILSWAFGFVLFVGYIFSLIIPNFTIITTSHHILGFAASIIAFTIVGYIYRETS